MAYFTKYVCFYKLDGKNTLLLNTLTSALDVIDNITFSKINKMIKNIKAITYENDPVLFEQLKKRGYLFESIQGEQELLNYFQKKNKDIISNTMITDFKICPTLGCNLRCTYCYESHKNHENYNIMSDKQLNIIFRYIYSCKQRLKQYKVNIPIHVGLFGGEPLLKSNYKIVEKVLKFSKKLKNKLYIVTNGLTINDYAKLLSQFKEIIHVQVTLDGNKTLHNKKRIYSSGVGTFDKICNGINKLLDIGIKTTVRINVDRENLNYIGELKELFYNQSWNKNSLFRTYATPIRNYDKGNINTILTDSELLDVFMKNNWYGTENAFIDRLDSSVYDVLRIFNHHKENEFAPWQISYCSASQGTQLIFTPDGTISTCLKCTGEKDYSIGSFSSKRVQIDKNKFNLWKNRNPFYIPKCKDCKFILFCSGGCPYYALKNFGNINHEICNDIEKTLEVYVKHNKNKFLKFGRN